MRRLGIGAGLVGVVILAASWFSPLGRSLLTSGSPAGPVPGVAYAIDVESRQSAFDLDFSSDARYVLVIGSLAHSSRQFTIECSSKAIAVPRTANWHPVPPLAPRASSRETTSEQDGSQSDAPPPAQLKSGSSAVRSFALHVTDGSLDDPAQYLTTQARAVADGQNVRVYLDEHLTERDLAPGLVRTVADLFDHEVIPRLRPILGTYRDVDHDGRFAVFVTPWLGQLQGGRTSVGGFVRGSDFQSRLEPPFSNHCDMMYLNSRTLPGPHLRTLLIHEYTHAVCFSRRAGEINGEPRFPEEEDWLNEAIAHCAESLFGGGWTNLDYRLCRYLNDPASFPLVVDDYYRAGLWRCHGCRGATYLFLRYCLERFGPETLNRIIETPARGTRNVELATGCPFNRLFRDWNLSLICDRTSCGEGCTSIEPWSQSRSPGLAPLDLEGPLGDWGLAGPRRIVWDVDSGSLAVRLKGTTAAFIELHASAAGTVRRIQLAEPRGAQMQVSLIRLPADAPRIEVHSDWRDPTPGHGPLASSNQIASRSNSIAGGPAIRSPIAENLCVVVKLFGDEGLSVTQISAEQNVAETHASICFSGDSLKSLNPQGSEGHLIFELPASRLSAPEAPIVVKVVATNRLGRRTSGWATVMRPRPLERLAQRHP